MSIINEWTALVEIGGETYLKNVEAVRQHQPHIYERIHPYLTAKQLVIRYNGTGYDCAWIDQGEVQLLASYQAIQKDLSRAEQSLRALSPSNDASLIYVLGFELGYSFQILQPYLARRNRKAALILEPDARLFAASLAIHPLHSALGSNRIQWVIGGSPDGDLVRIFDEQHYFAVTRAEVFFSALSQDPKRAAFWGEIRTQSQQAAAAARKRFEQELLETRLYYSQKKPDELCKAMAPYYESGKAIPYIQKRFLQECARLGVEVVYHKPSFIGGIALLRDISRERPDFLLCINKSPSELAPIQILDQLRLPRLIWCIDDPNVFIKDAFGLHDFVFTWDTSYTQNLLDKQARGVDHFPYVADLDGVDAKYEERFAAPVSYIGQVTPFSREDLGIEEKFVPLIEKVGQSKAYEPERSYQSLVLQYQGEYGLEVIQSEKDEVPRSIRYGMYVIGNALRRILVLEQAMPFGLKLYGGESWLDILQDHPLRECYQGVADPEQDVPAIFVSSTINLNIHSLQALSSLNQRDFNCPLVGGFLLTDWVEGADRFFVPDREMVFYDGLDDLAGKIAYYLENEDERREISLRGQSRVLSEHTYASRVPQVLRTLQEKIRQRYVPESTE